MCVPVRTLVENDYPDGNGSLIGNYIYVDGDEVEATVTTDASSPDSPTGKYDWTEYDYADPEAPRMFIRIRSGSSAGEDDFTDDTGNVTVSVDDTSQQYPWNLPQNAVGETIAIPLNVEYHWPDVDKSVASAHKTVYAQKGIVVRIEVPEEIWAGESRPVFAVLNGKYNDGSAKCGDVPWDYDIVWQFAEPVWEQEGSGEDITYTHRPPEAPDEYIPSAILTGGRRLKHDTSPLYVGDMTSDSWGLVYVRAVISGVNVTSGEVTQGAGDETITSAWGLVFVAEETHVVNQLGYATDRLCIYSPDEIEGMPRYKHGDHLEALSILLQAPLATDAVDIILAQLYDDEYVLEETSINSKVFQTPEADFSVTINGPASLSPTERDLLDVTVNNVDYGIDNATLDMLETDNNSCYFSKVVYTVDLTFGGPLNESEPDCVLLHAQSSHTAGLVRRRLTETGANTRVFRDEQGLTTASITSLTGMASDTVDTLEMTLDCYSLNSVLIDCALEETTQSSLVFTTHIELDVPVIGFLPFSIASPFKVVVNRWPGVAGATMPVYLWSSVDEQSMDLAMDITQGIWVSMGVGVAIPPGTAPTTSGHSTYNEIDTKLEALAKYVEALLENIDEDPAHYELGVATDKWMALCEQHRTHRNQWWDVSRLIEYTQMHMLQEGAVRVGLHGFAIVGTTLSGHKKHISEVSSILNNEMGYSPKDKTPLRFWSFRDELVRERNRIRKSRTAKRDPWFLYDIYYTTSHGAGVSDDDHTFAGLLLTWETSKNGERKRVLDDATFGPSFWHQPSLVFPNACASRLDPENHAKSKAKLMFQRFNAKLYVGWDSESEYEYADAAYAVAPHAGKIFWEKLRDEETVFEAINAVNTWREENASKYTGEIQLEYWSGTYWENGKQEYYSPHKKFVLKESMAKYIRPWSF